MTDEDGPMTDLDLSKHARFPGWAPGMPVVRDTGGWGVGEGIVLEVPSHGRYICIGGLEGNEQTRAARLSYGAWRMVEVFAGDPVPCRFNHNHPAALGFVWAWAAGAWRALYDEQHHDKEWGSLQLHLMMDDQAAQATVWHDGPGCRACEQASARGHGAWCSEECRNAPDTEVRMEGSPDEGEGTGGGLASLVWQLWDRLDAEAADDV